MLPFLKSILSIFSNKQALSSDHLEVYPQKVHVRAFPERRYLKTSRFLVICCLISALFNFAVCFFYIRNTDRVHTRVYNPNSVYTYLYSLDYYNKELKPVERQRRVLHNADLVIQNLIQDYLTKRYDLLSDIQQMNERWNPNEALSLYLDQKQQEELKNEIREKYTLLRKGITQKTYIHSIKPLNNNDFYEAVFDVFSLQSNVYGAQTCQCFTMDQECLACLQKESVRVQRYKAYMRVAIEFQAPVTQQLIPSKNPFQFKIRNYYLMEYRYVPVNIQSGASKKEIPYSPWEDPDNILE